MSRISGFALIAAFVVAESVLPTAYGLQSGSDGRVMWENNCDFSKNDFRSMRAIPAACGDICADDMKCTHWAWNYYNGGTCWFKTGTPSTKLTQWSTNCGYVISRSRAGDNTFSNGLSASEMNEMLIRINTFRSQNGLPGLSIDNRLVSAATLHSQDQARNCRMTHTGSNGSKVGARARLQAYNFSLVQENVAAGQKTVENVMTAWINSPSHRANLLEKDVKNAGFAKAGNIGCEYTTFWTLDFGRLA